VQPFRVIKGLAAVTALLRKSLMVNAAAGDGPHSKGNGGRHGTAVKPTVKYLAVCTDPQAYRAVLRAAPDSVIRSIADAPCIVEQRDVQLSPSQKAFFRKRQDIVATLSSPHIGIRRKRRTIIQKSGLSFLPIMIGTALGALGIRLFGGAASSSQ
jgi:hypothetical protein